MELLYSRKTKGWDNARKMVAVRYLIVRRGAGMGIRSFLGGIFHESLGVRTEWL